MAKPRTSSKTVAGKQVCDTCKEPKSALEYASTTATTCSTCLSVVAAPPEAVEAPVFIPTDSEVDYNNPTAQEIAARTLARRKLLHFIKRFKPKYTAGWVHEDICRRLERFMKDVEEQKSPRLLLMMPVRHGKLLADSTPMHTRNGWTTHGELQVGDEVFGPDGMPTKIMALSDKGVANVRVTFSDGASLLCHENHEWTVFQRSHSKWITVETNFWLNPGRFGKQRQMQSAGRYIYQMPEVSPLEYSPKDLPLAPYAFGAWLGDGSAGKACITHHADDVAVIDGIVELGYPVSSICDQAAATTKTTYFGSGVPNTRNAFSQGLKDTGALRNKHIPRLYLHTCVEHRLELLAGLIDTDGHVDGKSGRVRVVTVSDRLRDDIVELVRSLGMRAGCHTQQPAVSTSGIVGRRPTHYVSFTPTMPIPTRIPRKAIYGNRREAVAIVSVERVEASEQGSCIQVAREDGLYLAGEHLTPTHNSEIGSRHFTPFVLGHHPDWEIIAASGAQSLATSFSRYIRDLVRSDGYRALFPAMNLDQSSQSVENWNTTAGGGYLAAGIGTMITGRGGHILLIDDPVKDAEAADSQVIRDSVWEWYISTALTRLAPGGGVLGILTWWNEDDWAGRIQQLSQMDEGGDKFEIVKYPAINDQGDEYILADDSIVQLPPGSSIPAGSRLTRLMNTALHPIRYTYEALMKTRATFYALGQQRWWAALYQQNPAPDDGVYFTKGMFKFYQHEPHALERRTYQAWDFAITEKQQNDYTVGATAHQDSANGLYFTDVVRFKSDDAFIIADAILDNWVKHGSCALLGFEDGQIWKSISAVFLRRCQERELYPAYELLVPLTDKGARAQPLKGLMQSGKVWFKDKAPWWDELRKEFTQFLSGGKHDDIVDACSWVARLSLRHIAPKAPAPKPMKSWKDKLKGMLGGRGGSHMAA